MENRGEIVWEFFICLGVKWPLSFKESNVVSAFPTFVQRQPSHLDRIHLRLKIFVQETAATPQEVDERKPTGELMLPA